MVLINLIASWVTLSTGQKKGGVFVQPKSMYAGVGEKEAKGEGSRGRVGEEGGETARAEHQADTSCQPIRDALGSCRDPAWEPGAGGAEPEPGLSRGPRAAVPRALRKCPPSAFHKLSSFPPVRASQPR